MDFIDYTSQANAPVNVKPQGRGGLASTGHLTEFPYPWVGNDKRFDVTQDPEGGGISQDFATAWDLISAWHPRVPWDCCFRKLLGVHVCLLPVHC